MQRVTFVPGAVVSPAAITLPTEVPDIDLVLAAEIVRLPAGATIPDHAAQAHAAAAGGPEACAGCAVDDHVLAGGGGAASVALAAGLFTDTGAGGNVAHNVGAQPTITHANIVAGVDDHPALVHGASVGANPVVAAVATRLTTRTISLSVNTALGDLLVLDYIEVGARVPTS